MINVVGSSPPPAMPLPPDLPSDVPAPEATSVQTSETPLAPEGTAAPGGPTPKPPQNKNGIRNVIAGVVLFVLVVGGGIGMYLMSQQQDIRQQAKKPDCNIAGNECNPGYKCNAAGKCVEKTQKDREEEKQKDEPDTTTEKPKASGCSPTHSAANCQNGKNPGASCGSDGTCTELPNQPDPNGIPKCECRRPEAKEEPKVVAPTTTTTPTPTPTATPTPTPTPEESNDDNDDGGEQIASAPAPTPTPEPVVLPSTLPETGPEDWLKYLQVGLGVLGAGALLLLFL